MPFEGAAARVYERVYPLVDDRAALVKRLGYDLPGALSEGLHGLVQALEVACVELEPLAHGFLPFANRMTIISTVSRVPGFTW